jgi:hypothetical protein
VAGGVPRPVCARLVCIDTHPSTSGFLGRRGTAAGGVADLAACVHLLECALYCTALACVLRKQLKEGEGPSRAVRVIPTRAPAPNSQATRGGPSRC